jgi:hypothetical protein
LSLRLGEEGANAVEEPVDLAFAAQEDAAQHQAGAALGMGLGIGERQGRAPRTAEHQPALNPKLASQRFHVGDQVRGGVVGKFAVRRGAAAAALVEQDDPVTRRVKKSSLVGRGAGSGAAVHEQHRNTLGVAGGFPVDAVDAWRFQHAAGVGGDGRVKRRNFRHGMKPENEFRIISWTSMLPPQP